MNLPDRDDLPPPKLEDPPGPVVLSVAACALVLIYIAALVLLRPGP
jgi:hypothetical protein